MADFHIKDTYGNNYKIGGNVSGIYHLPISKLITVREVKLIDTTDSQVITVNGNDFYTTSMNQSNLTLNNATFIPVCVVGWHGLQDAYLSTQQLYLNEYNDLYCRIVNPTTTARNIYSLTVQVLYVCDKVPWLSV